MLLAASPLAKQQAAQPAEGLLLLRCRCARRGIPSLLLLRCALAVRSRCCGWLLIQVQHACWRTVGGWREL